MRLYDPTTRKYGSAGPLTVKRPALPSAVPLFLHGRARVVALDFDTKNHGHAAVTADVARVLAWLTECGGRAVVDQSTSGGRHVLIPLAPGKTVSVDEIRPLLRLLAVRLPTLDITPMTNAKAGCITVPGSRCKEGGHRELVDLDPAAALDILTIGSDAATVPRLEALLGGTGRTPTTPTAAYIRTETMTERVVGAGNDARLHPRFCRNTPPPRSVVEFARTGRIDSIGSSRWPSRSEARQSVITHAVLAGATPADVLARTAAPEWAGLRAAYARYSEPARALRRDTARALEWAAATLPDPVRDIGHKQKHTGGTYDPVLCSWLTHAQIWIGIEFARRRDRWSAHAVIQGLAWAAAVSGQVVEGIPTVGVGGRSLSIAAGMLPESTVWAILERLREMEGSPLLLIERGVGQNPDRYALVSTPAARTATPSAEVQHESGGIASVHPAWSIIGWRHRILYDAVAAASEPMTPEDLFAAVGIGRTSGYEALLDLRIAGLLTVENTQVSLGTVELDDIGRRHGLTFAVRARIVRHRAERIVWREWLAAREEARTPPEPDPTLFAIADDHLADPPEPEYITAVMNTGPPDPL